MLEERDIDECDDLESASIFDCDNITTYLCYMWDTVHVVGVNLMLTVKMNGRLTNRHLIDDLDDHFISQIHREGGTGIGLVHIGAEPSDNFPRHAGGINILVVDDEGKLANGAINGRKI